MSSVRGSSPMGLGITKAKELGNRRGRWKANSLYLEKIPGLD